MTEPSYTLLTGYLTDEECMALEAIASTIEYRKSPTWLGNFQFRMYNRSTNPVKCPEGMRAIARRLASIHSEQQFNTVFVQKYSVGNEVKEHRDPRNNTGYTIIGIFGTSVHGSVHFIAGKSFTVTRGDVLGLPCTIDGVQGPRHSVSPVLVGTRYSLILNTINQEK